KRSNCKNRNYWNDWFQGFFSVAASKYLCIYRTGTQSGTCDNVSWSENFESRYESSEKGGCPSSADPSGFWSLVELWLLVSPLPGHCPGSSGRCVFWPT